MPGDTQPPRLHYTLGPPQGGWFREALAHVRLLMLRPFWRLRVRWLAQRRAVRVSHWRDPLWVRILIAVLALLTAVLMLWVARAVWVVVTGESDLRLWGFDLLGFNPDSVCASRGTSCGAITGTAQPVLAAAAATVLFLAWRLKRVMRYLRKQVRRDATRIVQTAGSLLDEVVGRDQLCDALMNNLADRRVRRPHVIVGGVGAGKTAVLVELTRRLSEQGAFPVPIRLRDVQAEEELDFCRLARRRFEDLVAPVAFSGGEVDRLWRWMGQRSDRIVVLADGLEEALEGRQYDGQRDNLIRNAIRKASKECLPLVIASRPHDPLHGMEAAITELEPLNEEAALAYIRESGSWRSDPAMVDRVVEAARMVESPLYLQLARDLHRHNLLEPLWTGLSGDELALQDRWPIREELQRAWLDALVDGTVRPELPIDRDTRQAVVEYISALACVGLACDKASVALTSLDPLPPSDGARPGDTAARREWVDRVAHELGERIAQLRRMPLIPRPSASEVRVSVALSGAGARIEVENEPPPARHPADSAATEPGAPVMDVKQAATWGTRMGLVREVATSSRAVAGFGTVGDTDRSTSVHFQHTILQAYLGSRFLPQLLKPSGELLTRILPQSGREFLIALVLCVHSLEGQPARFEGDWRDRLPGLLADYAEQLKGEGIARERRLFRQSATQSVNRTDNPARRALEVFTAAIEIASEAARPSLSFTQVLEKLERDWPVIGNGDDWARLREAKLSLVDQCGAAAHRVATEHPDRAGYPLLFAIGCNERDLRVRTALAAQLGLGKEQAYEQLAGDLAAPTPMVVDVRSRPVIPNSDHRDLTALGPRLRREALAWQQRERERHERRIASWEADGENRLWHRNAMSAWLLPMLVERADMTGHTGSPWADLEHWVSVVGGARSSAGSAAELSAGERTAIGHMLAQGFKLAANRRLTLQPEGREFLVKQAKELLANSSYWYTRLTLVQALTLWALPDSPTEPMPARGRGADPAGQLHEWLSAGGHKGGHKDEHPLVDEARRLAVRAMQTRRPERFLWMDEVDVASRIGTRAGAPGEPRFHNLWIAPSTGWSTLDPQAQQLVADVLLLLVLGERDLRPKELFRQYEQGNQLTKLPSCLSHDRTRLDPARAVAGRAQPGDNCRDDCGLRLCPYPEKARELRFEFSELLCLHQRALLKRWQPRSWRYFRFRREARWQRRVPIAGLRRFWDEMGDRARDISAG